MKTVVPPFISARLRDMQSSKDLPKPKGAPDDAGALHTILVSLIGLSPSVLTETLWALADAPERIVPDRVVVLTTTTGAGVLKKSVLADARWEDFKKKLARKHGRGRVDGRLRFGSSDSIRIIRSPDGSGDLDDIRTPEQNDAMADFFMEQIRGLAQDEGHSRLIVSIAGGRKTMGALLHSVMTLIGRADDRVYHILVDEPWERVAGFLYPGCPGKFRHPDTGEPLSSNKARLALAEVPFVPLRYLFERDLKKNDYSYRRLIENYRRRATADGDTRAGSVRLEIDFKTQTATFGGKSLGRLAARQFAAIAAWAQKTKDAGGDEKKCDLFCAGMEDYIKAADTPDFLKKLVPSGAMDAADFNKAASQLRQLLRRGQFPPAQIDRIIPHKGAMRLDLQPQEILINQ
jgi:CRISPR-associated protein (TIGR02584 family)